MSPSDAAYTVALVIGAAIVAWCALMVFQHDQRITRLESKGRKCKCGERDA